MAIDTKSLVEAFLESGGEIKILPCCPQKGAKAFPQFVETIRKGNGDRDPEISDSIYVISGTVVATSHVKSVGTVITAKTDLGTVSFKGALERTADVNPGDKCSFEYSYPINTGAVKKPLYYRIVNPVIIHEKAPAPNSL